MTNDEMILLYDSIINREFNNKELGPVINELYRIFDYYDDFMLKTASYKCNDLIKVNDEDKISFVIRILPIIKKIINNNLLKSFKDITNYMIIYNVSASYIPIFLNLIYFPNDYLDFKNKNDKEITKIIESSLFIIEQLLIFDAYNYSKYKFSLLELRNNYYEYTWNNKKDDYNGFIPSIILFCLEHNFDNNKLINMLDFSYNSYEDLCNYMLLNDDLVHSSELYFYVINKINKESCNKLIMK